MRTKSGWLRSLVPGLSACSILWTEVQQLPVAARLEEEAKDICLLWNKPAEVYLASNGQCKPGVHSFLVTLARMEGEACKRWGKQTPFPHRLHQTPEFLLIKGATGGDGLQKQLVRLGATLVLQGPPDLLLPHLILRALACACRALVMPAFGGNLPLLTLPSPGWPSMHFELSIPWAIESVGPGKE